MGIYDIQGSDCNTLSTNGLRNNQDESPNTSGSPYRILPPIGYEVYVIPYNTCYIYIYIYIYIYNYHYVVSIPY